MISGHLPVSYCTECPRGPVCRKQAGENEREGGRGQTMEALVSPLTLDGCHVLGTHTGWIINTHVRPWKTPSILSGRVEMGSDLCHKKV